jgi:hypothetical protein
MEQQNLYFNILTFNWPQGEINFYFHEQENKRYPSLHKSLFPKQIASAFPAVARNPQKDFIACSFTGAVDGFTPLSINFQTENPDLIKRYYNRQINYFFRKIKKQIVKTGFIKENQIWLPAPKEDTAQYQVFDKYTIKVQLCSVSNFPEIHLSYDGKSRVSKKSVATLINDIAPENFNWVLYQSQLWKYETLNQKEEIDYTNAFPVLGRRLKSALGFPAEAPARNNRYKEYLKHIEKFYKEFLNTTDFKEFIPLHNTGFLPVNSTRLNSTSLDSNKLAFGSGQDIVPFNGVKAFGPFKKAPYNKIHMFFIVHKDDTETAKKLKEYFQTGLKFFKGLFDFSKILFHTSEGFSIVFSNKENPLEEIEQKLSQRTIDPDVKYIAIYITPFNKYEADLQKREIYYKVKEMLLKRKMTSQCIEANKVIEQGENYVFSLPNIAVAILAKLDGIPWRLNTPIKNELIVGVGAFKHIASDVQYIGSAFSFNNTGGFNRFEYFMKHEVDVLAGSISRAIRDYATINSSPDRLIIHFYKTMNDKELEPIQNALADLGLNIPVFIVSINKTESEDIVVFDKGWDELMPISGTYVNIGEAKYLLCNNTRYSSAGFSKNDGFPFPIKLKIECTVKAQLSETRVIKELIDQVYQFSRMYWKSVRQQNLPVTIKYPEMVAQIAPHFDGDEIPQYGKDNLWFL